LESLYGVGTYLAQKIVWARDKRGGFASINMVGETEGLPDSTFQKIKAQLKIETPPKKLLVNSADQKTLAAHAYIDWKQSKFIIAYREQHGPYRSIQEIGTAVPSATKEWLEKIEPYLQF
jgi:competence protein ComEA